MILIPERQQPILAQRIVYYEDPCFQKIMAAQSGPLPYPSQAHREIGALSEQVQALMGQVTALSKVRLIDYEVRKGDDGGNSESPAPASTSQVPSEQRQAITQAAEELAASAEIQWNSQQSEPHRAGDTTARDQVIASGAENDRKAGNTPDQALSVVVVSSRDQTETEFDEEAALASLRLSEAAARKKMDRMAAKIASK